MFSQNYGIFYMNSRVWINIIPNLSLGHAIVPLYAAIHTLSNWLNATARALVLRGVRVYNRRQDLAAECLPPLNL